MPKLTIFPSFHLVLSFQLLIYNSELIIKQTNKQMPIKETKLIFMEDFSHSQYSIDNHKISLVRLILLSYGRDDKIKA